MTVATRWQANENEYRVLPADRPTRTPEKPFVNDPRIYEPIKVKILRPFCFKHKVLERGTVIELPKCLANDMCACGKAERE
jgi:hypothetical protein